MNLPGGLAELYSKAYGRYAFAVLDPSGTVLFSSLSDRGAIIPTAQKDEIAYFTLNRDAAELYGATVPTQVAGRRLWIQCRRTSPPAMSDR